MNSTRYHLVIFFCGLTLYSMLGFHDNFWSPFLPTEFTDRGLSESTTGVIVASYDVACLMTPILIFAKKNIALNKYTFCLSALSQGLLTILFGLSINIDSNFCFILLCIIIRVVMGIGNALLWCSGAKIFLSLFPNDAGKIFSAIPASVSIGIILGTPYGSLTYGIGGYYLPFVIVGGCETTLAIINFTVLSMNPDKFFSKKDITIEENDYDGKSGKSYCIENEPTSSGPLLSSSQTGGENISVMRFLTDTGVLTLSLLLIAYTSTIGFFFVCYGPYLLNGYEIQSQHAGPYFLPYTVVRAVIAPLFGYITDHGFAGAIFACLSAIFGIPPLLIFGLAEFADGLNNIYLVEFLIASMGVSSMACFVSFIPLIRKMFQKKFGTYNTDIVDTYTSGVFCVCCGTGMVFGQSFIGGIALQHMGFNYCCLIEAIILLISNTVALFYLIKNCLLFD